MAAIDKTTTQIIFFAVIGFVLQYTCNIYLARSIPSNDYGDFAVAISMLLILAMLVELGASKTIPKFIHFYKANDDIPHISGLLRGFILVGVLFSIVVAIVGSGLGYLELEIAHKKTNSAELHPLILALWFLPFIVQSNILASYLKCINPHSNSELPRTLLYGLTILFLWLYAEFGFIGNDWSGIALFGGANLIVLLSYIYLGYRHIPHHYLTVTAKYEWRLWFITSLPIMISGILFLGTRQVSLYMVEAFDASETSVGYFSAAIQTAQGLVTIYDTANLIYGSRIGLSITQGKEAIQKTLRNMTIFMSCFCLVFMLCLVYFGKSILGLFGEDYIQAYPAMILLAIGACGRVISGGYTTFLQYYGKQNQVLAVQISMLILSIILSIVLIPVYGINGAGIASAASFAIMSAFFILSATRLLRRVKPTSNFDTYVDNAMQDSANKTSKS